ncbi:MAG: hypothetical protein AAF225_05705 [Pseudomonadota bacterium]
MIKSILKRRGQGDDENQILEANGDFDITTGRFPGRSVIAFQKRGGQVTALEVTEQGAEIVKGLAVGAIISELEEARDDLAAAAVLPLTSDRGASREEAEAFIQSLDLLDAAEKQMLLGALPR